MVYDHNLQKASHIKLLGFHDPGSLTLTAKPCASYFTALFAFMKTLYNVYLPSTMVCKRKKGEGECTLFK